MADKPAHPEEFPKQDNSRQWILWGAVVLAAFLVRVLFLGRADLWTEEILFATKSSPPATPWGVLKTTYQQFVTVTHVPLPRLVQNLFLWFFQSPEADLIHNPFLQRFPAVVWGTLGVWAMIPPARRIVPGPASTVAILLMAFSLYPIFFSREAYYYAPLLFFSTALLGRMVRLLGGEAMRGRDWVTLFLLSAGMVWTHMTGSIVLLLLIVLTGLLIAFRSRIPVLQSPVRNRVLAVGAGLMALSFLVVLPFFLQFLSGSNPHHFRPGPSWWQILHDVVGKFFLGNMWILNLAAWGLLAAGLWSWFRGDSKEPGRSSRILVGSWLVAGLLVLAVAADRTQYAARYFTALTPAVLLVFASGLQVVARAVVRIPGVSGVSALLVMRFLAGAIVAVHLLVFLPTYYALPAKGVDFGGIADWLNEHVETGRPYVLESGYETRFISGYHETPNRVPAVPYTHGNGPEEMEKLRDAQKEFLLRFPEAPWVESARHGREPGEPLGTWEWPHEFFRRRHDVYNKPLERLSEWGVWLQAWGGDEKVKDIFTPIWYNTPEDVRAMALERGDAVRINYGNWQCVQIQRGVYVRLWRRPVARCEIENLRGEPVRGRFVFQAGIAAPQGTYGFAIQVNGTNVAAARRPAGQIWEVRTSPVVLPEGLSTLQWGVGARAQGRIQGLLLYDWRFMEEQAPPETGTGPDEESEE